MSNKKDINRYLANMQKEIAGAASYLTLAASEKQPQMVVVGLVAAALTFGIGRLISVSIS